MIKVDLYKLNTTNYFSNVRLELLPTEIVIYFKDKTFNILYNEIIQYKYVYNSMGNDIIKLELPGKREKLNIVIKPYEKKSFSIICHHLDMYCKRSIEYTVNPIFKTT